jgi:hypothetical protein
VGQNDRQTGRAAAKLSPEFPIKKTTLQCSASHVSLTKIVTALSINSIG